MVQKLEIPERIWFDELAEHELTDEIHAVDITVSCSTSSVPYMDGMVGSVQESLFNSGDSIQLIEFEVVQYSDNESYAAIGNSSLCYREDDGIAVFQNVRVDSAFRGFGLGRFLHDVKIATLFELNADICYSVGSSDAGCTLLEGAGFKKDNSYNLDEPVFVGKTDDLEVDTRTQKWTKRKLNNFF